MTTSGATEDDIAERLRLSIGRFTRVVRALSDTMPQTQAAALGTLDREGPQTIARLAAERGVKHQGMSRTVAELETLGWVSRSANPEDGRAFLIALAPEGRAALELDRQSRRNWIAEAMENGLSAEDREVLYALPDVLDRLSTLGEQG